MPEIGALGRHIKFFDEYFKNNTTYLQETKIFKGTVELVNKKIINIYQENSLKRERSQI